MSMSTVYLTEEPSRSSVDASQESTLLEFGTAWCGHCQAAQPLLSAALGKHPHVRHLKVEDGKGRALGRSFRVKLWPTLVFLDNGREVARLVRPTQGAALDQALALLGGSQ